MMFASWLAEQFFWMMVFLAMGLGAVGMLFKRFDSEGQIKSAARTGIVALISRWLK